MYVARDKDGRLFLYHRKPKRSQRPDCYFWEEDFESMGLDSSLFPNLTWDDEPLEVEISEVERKTLCSIKGCPVGGGYCNYYCESRDVCSQG